MKQFLLCKSALDTSPNQAAFGQLSALKMPYRMTGGWATRVGKDGFSVFVTKSLIYWHCLSCFPRRILGLILHQRQQIESKHLRANERKNASSFFCKTNIHQFSKLSVHCVH